MYNPLKFNIFDVGGKKSDIMPYVTEAGSGHPGHPCNLIWTSPDSEDSEQGAHVWKRILLRWGSDMFEIGEKQNKQTNKETSKECQIQVYKDICDTITMGFINIYWISQ